MFIFPTLSETHCDFCDKKYNEVCFIVYFQRLISLFVPDIQINKLLSKICTLSKGKRTRVYICDIIITFYKPVSAELDGTAHVDVSDAGDNISDGGRKSSHRHFPNFFELLTL